MKCKACGAEMSDNNKFCPACGADLREEIITTAEPAAAVAAETAASAAAAQPKAAATVATVDPSTLPRNNAPAPRFFEDDLAPIVTTGQWLLALILLMLLPTAAVIVACIIGNLVDNAILLSVLPPVAGLLTFLILVFVWAFNSRTNPSKRNFFRAYLLFTLITIVITIALALAFGSYIIGYYQQMGITDMNQLLGTLAQ